MRTLCLNSKNIVEGTGNSQLTFQFPAGAINLIEGDQLALSSVSMYNSVFNITAALGNNTFKYTWVDATVKTVTIVDGFYDVDALNDYLHQIMLNNGHYLIENSTGNFVWFLTIQINVTIYAIQIQAYPMESTTYVIGTTGGTYKLPTFTGSMTAWVVPTGSITPYIEIQANALRTTLGDFAAASEPQDRRIRTAIVRHQRDTAPHPGPRSHCRAGLSFAADARAYSELGSHAKTGLRARRAPRIGRRAPTANEAAPRDRAAIARRIGAPAQTRARAAAARRRGWLQSALREPEHRPRSRGHRA